MNPMLRTLVLLSALAVAPLASAEDLTGVYQHGASRLAVVEARGRVLAVFRTSVAEPDGSLSSCTCTAPGEHTSPAVVALHGAFEGGKLLRSGETLLLVALDATCCGAGWQGHVAFEADARDALPRCRVRTSPTFWYAPPRNDAAPEALRPTQEYTTRGDVLEALPDAPDATLVPARRLDPRPRVGLLRREDLDCLLPRRSARASTH